MGKNDHDPRDENKTSTTFDQRFLSPPHSFNGLGAPTEAPAPAPRIPHWVSDIQDMYRTAASQLWHTFTYMRDPFRRFISSFQEAMQQFF